MTFRGVKLMDPSALLADIGVGSESEFGVSVLPEKPAIYWNRDALNALKPIFEAEIRIDSGRDKGQTRRLFVQWSSLCSKYLERASCYQEGRAFKVELTVMCQVSEGGEWKRYPKRIAEQFKICGVKEQRDVFRYLERDDIQIIQDGYDDEKFISVDLSNHIYKKRDLLKIDDFTGAKFKGSFVPFEPKYWPVEWSVTLTSVKYPRESRLESFMSTHQSRPFTIKQMLRKLGLLNFAEVLAQEAYDREKLSGVELSELTSFGIDEELGSQLIGFCRQLMPPKMDASRDRPTASVVATNHRDPNAAVGDTAPVLPSVVNANVRGTSRVRERRQEETRAKPDQVFTMEWLESDSEPANSAQGTLIEVRYHTSNPKDWEFSFYCCQYEDNMYEMKKLSPRRGETYAFRVKRITESYRRYNMPLGQWFPVQDFMCTGYETVDSTRPVWVKMIRLSPGW